MTQLTNAVAAILDRKAGYDVAAAYYEGTVGEVMTSSSALLRHLRLNGRAYTTNFTRTVVDSVANRLELANVVATTQVAQAQVNKVFRQEDFQIEANEIHRRALEFGDCYAIVWPDEDGNLEVTYNSPINTAVVYDPETRKKAYAVKMWLVPTPLNTNDTRLNLYYPDRIEKYSAKGDLVTEGTQWTRIDTLENPFGEVPVFHFRTHRPYGRPEHMDAYNLQNAVNKTMLMHMFTMDYQGAPQRYALANTNNDAEIEDFNEGDTDRENLGSLKNGPGELWYLKGVTSVGEFKPADPETFLKPVEAFLRSMASITSTPLHYFEQGSSAPSGEALRTAEAPLMKKVQDRQQAFGAAWRDLFRFILRVEGVAGDVEISWKAVESLDSLDTWDVMLKKINAGLSHRQALREGGYTEQDIEKIMNERQEELAEGLYYQRAPQTRVGTQSNEVDAVPLINGNEE